METSEPEAPIAPKSGGKKPGMSVEDRLELADRAIEMHYFFSLPPRSIAGFLNTEEVNRVKADPAAARPGFPVDAKWIAKTIRDEVRRRAVNDSLDKREAAIRAKVRYEGLFRHLIAMIKRAYRPAGVGPGPAGLTPAVMPLEDSLQISAVKAAAGIQARLDKLQALDDDDAILKEVDSYKAEKDFDPVGICQQLLESMGDDPQAAEKVKMVFDSHIRGSLATKRERMAGGSPQARRKPTRRV